MNYQNYSLRPDELLRASHPSPFVPAALFKFFAEEFVGVKLAASGKPTPCRVISAGQRSAGRSCVAGDADRTTLIHLYGYAAVDIQSTLAARFRSICDTSRQYTGRL